MSKTVAIVTSKKNRWGQKIQVPVLGKIDVPEDGRMEVDEQVAEMLVKTSVGWEYASGEAKYKKGKPETKKADKKEVVDEAPVVEEDETPAEEATDKKDLSGLTYTELRDVATEANLPEAEWKKIKSQKVMLAYLTDKV